jgi:predicted ester cyclase
LSGKTDRLKKDEAILKKEVFHMNRILAAVVLAMLAVAASFANDHRAEKNKATIRRVFTDILSQGKYEVTAEIYAKDFVNHGTTKDIGIDEDEANNRGWRSAFPDLDITVEREIAEGDFVTVLWKATGTNTGSGNGLNATGKKTEGRGISVFRIVDGKIKEEWTEFSQLLVLRQLGLLPARQ